jgi:hypothetical protein
MQTKKFAMTMEKVMMKMYATSTHAAPAPRLRTGKAFNRSRNDCTIKGLKMNAIVFVLMVINHGEPLPTIEFSTMEKCKASIVAINNSDGVKANWAITRLREAFCVRIEK